MDAQKLYEMMKKVQEPKGYFFNKNKENADSQPWPNTSASGCGGPPDRQESIVCLSIAAIAQNSI